MKLVQKATMENNPLLAMLPGGDMLSVAFAKIDCEAFAEKHHSACERSVAEMSSGIRSGMYDVCMQSALTNTAGANLMQSILPSITK